MTFNHRLTAAVAAICLVVGAATARTAQQIFADAPAELFPMLDRNARLDMADYYNSGLSTPVADAAGGKAKITRLDDNSVCLELSPVAAAQLVVLPLKNDTVVGLIETVRTPQPDSHLSFYRLSDWSTMDVGGAAPGIDDFIDPARRKEARTAEMPPYMFVHATFDPESQTFVFVNATAAYYPGGEAPAGLSMLLPSLSRTFKGKKLVNAR